MSVRYGIVGCGNIHGTHAEALLGIPEASIAGFYDVISEKAKSAAEKYGGTAFVSLADLIEGCDAVSVCVPSGNHAEITLAAAQAAKHVICEKPIEVTMEKAVPMVTACRNAGVKFGVISQHRFAPDIQTLKAKLDAGELGKPLAGDMQNKWYRSQAYYDSAGWRGTWELDGGGCLMNQGVHYVDMLQWLLGGVKSVRAIARTSGHERIEVEDICNAMFEFENGAVGVMQASTAYYPGFAERLEIHCQHGSAIIEGDELRVYEVDPVAAGDGLYGRGVNAQPTPNLPMVGRTLPNVPLASPRLNWIETHQAQLRDFTHAVLEDREPFLTGADALKPLAIIRAIYESAAKGGEKVTI